MQRSLTALDQIVASPYGVFVLLVIAAALEVFGDSWFQSGLHRSIGLARLAAIATGVALLGCYGVLINLPNWNFGRLLGVYVAVFFLVAQIVARLRFNESPRPPVLLGGTLIVAGGMIIALWRA